MDRHFLLPATIAAAIHAGLLFGIRPEKAAAVINALPTKLIALTSDKPPFEEPPPEVEDKGEKAANSAPSAPPSLPEIPPANPTSTFEIKVPVVPVSVNTTPTLTIPVGPFGPPSDLPAGPNIVGGNVLNPADLDGSPRTRVQSSPPYPYSAKQAGITGEVTVEFTVDESGGVLSPRVVKSSNPIFNDSAMQGISRWKFEPGKRNGRVVRFKMMVPIVFSLNDQ
jgi:protein TonB